MKSLVTMAVVGVLSYNTLGAYETAHEAISGVTDVYSAAHKINFFAPVWMRAQQEKVLYDTADKRLIPIAVAAKESLVENQSPENIVYNFQNRLTLN